MFFFTLNLKIWIFGSLLKPARSGGTGIHTALTILIVLGTRILVGWLEPGHLQASSSAHPEDEELPMILFPLDDRIQSKLPVFHG